MFFRLAHAAYRPPMARMTKFGWRSASIRTSGVEWSGVEWSGVDWHVARPARVVQDNGW
jgi:hypothetical protein